jgi:hypothetical protein
MGEKQDVPQLMGQKPLMWVGQKGIVLDRDKRGIAVAGYRAWISALQVLADLTDGRPDRETSDPTQHSSRPSRINKST